MSGEQDWDGVERRRLQGRRATELDDPTLTALDKVYSGIMAHADATVGLTAAIVEAFRKEGRWNRIWMSLLTVGVCVSIFVGFQNKGFNEQTTKIVTFIEECTTPGKPCYEATARERDRAREQIRIDTNAAADRAIDQVECDLAGVCRPGVTPRDPNATTTTSSTTPLGSQGG